MELRLLKCPELKQHALLAARESTEIENSTARPILIFNVNSIAPFQLRFAELKWRKKGPRATREAPFCTSIELTLSL
jgi:hypothetical protein